MKLAEVLSGPETWCQNAMRKGDRVCLVGAIALSLGVDPDREDAFSSKHPVLNAALRLWHRMERPGPPGSTLMSWNDRPERTWDEIAAAVDLYDRDRMLNP